MAITRAEVRWRVHIQLPGQKTWAPGTCDKKVALLSYDVQVGGGNLWNRRDIRRSSQEPPMVEAELESSEMTDMPKQQPVIDDDQLLQEMPVEQPNVTVEPLQPTSPNIRCSERARKANVRPRDYVCWFAIRYQKYLTTSQGH